MSGASDFSDDGPFVDAEELDIPDVPGLELPTVSERFYALVDDDTGECRNISENELQESYVDNNIAAVEPLRPDVWTLDPTSMDSQDLRVRYTDGRYYALQLGSIDLEEGPPAYEFHKADGIIFAVDANGFALFDATSTPRLAFIRRQFHELLRQRSEQRLEIAEIVSAFADAVSALGTRADLKF